MNISLYWGMEYTKVLLGYVFLMFIWPSVVFRSYFRGKSLIFRFAFCVTLQVVLVNTVVLMLGLFHVLSPWIFRGLFYGSLLWSAFRNVKIGKKERNKFRYLLTGTYGFRHFVLKVTTMIKKRGSQFFRAVFQKLHSHWWECGLLGIIVVFGMMYFTYGAFQDYSYGFGDMYPHNAWTYGLTQGQIFSAGVYPEAMHCFLYALHVLFGIRIYSCLLFLAGIHAGVYLISAYVLLREVFRWRYTPMLVLTLFLTVDLVCIDEVYSMSRLQWTLPQEFGFYSMFLCAAFLLKYLRSGNRITRKGKLSKNCWDENLLVFMLALAASLAIHFYATIMAFFLCASFVPVLMHKVFRKKYFVPLVAAVICGFTVAVIPMGGALLSGIPFQGSIGWAMSVMNGEDPEQDETPNWQIEEEEQPGLSEGEEGMDGSSESAGITGADNIQNSGQDSAQGTDQAGGQFPAGGEQGFTDAVPGNAAGVTVQAEKPGIGERIRGIGQRLKTFPKAIWDYAYVTLYRQERAAWIVGFLGLAVLLWLLYRSFALFFNLSVKKQKLPANYFDHYFSVALASFIFMFMYNSNYVGFPQLIAGSRLCTTAQMLNLAMMMVPFDLIFCVIAHMVPLAIMKLVAVLCVGGIYAGTILTGTFHGFLYFEFTRYNEAVMTTISITRQLPKGSFTIVSAVDELYQVVQYGWHEELVNFINESIAEDYTLPSQYIFIYVEKKPLQYGQSHFFTGPRWLACEKYADYYNSYVSQCPEVTSLEISADYAADPVKRFPVHSDIYSNLYYRTVLESRMYEWCEQFKKLYPNELKTYFESDNFICYYFEQNVQRLYQLGSLPKGGSK